MAINQIRINKIYDELQTLNVDTFVNSVAVLLRVFIELSIDHYATKHKVKLLVIPAGVPCKNCGQATTPSPRDMNLRQKVDAVAKDMETQGFATSNELAGLKKWASSRNFAFSVVSLNAYVHNKDLNPRSDELKTTWDDVQLAIERLWTS